MFRLIILSVPFLILLFLSCNNQTNSTELKHFSVSDLNSIVAKSGIKIDKNVSNDGNGSLRIETTEPVSVPLYNIDDLRIENAQLTYEAKVKSENLAGQAYLEMWCVFKDKGEFFSRGFDSAISGTNDWKTIKTVFLLRKNEMPDKIKLNVIINGIGKIWIDDIRLLKKDEFNLQS
ncbi:MAG: hypothetical protein HXY48_12775 [Ignavibacteriaceae bacterium]|nr:hypothetical protein [Ignavibacteriaceae bacterium]